MAESIQTSIYKLRPAIAVLDSNGKLSSADVDLSYLETELNKQGYQSQKLKPFKKPGHDFRLFYNTWTTSVRWKEFISEIANPGEPVLDNDISVNEGFILLVSIKKKTKSDIYAITGGFG